MVRAVLSTHGLQDLVIIHQQNASFKQQAQKISADLRLEVHVISYVAEVPNDTVPWISRNADTRRHQTLATA